MIGSVLGGRYTLIGIVGIGGMAVVFSAHDKKTGDTVALKMLREDLGEDSTLLNFRSQFSNEARALSELNHSGVVKLYDSHLEKAPYYFVMEYVESITLKEYLSKKKILPMHEVIDFSIQILSALSHIHSKGIVHCDIKPHNILLMRNGRIKITDFGIARMPGVVPDLPPDQAIGTVYYVSPEQAEGKVLDHRSDLYSLGIMMYQMASGKLPFGSSDIDKVAKMQASAPPKRPRAINPDISKGLEQIILKALAKKPYMRFENANDMKAYLDILRKNPNAVFRLQERAPDQNQSDGAPIKYHSHNAYATLIGIVVAFALSISVAVPYINNSILSVNGDTVRLVVPDLRGKTLSDAAKKLNENLYDVEIIYDYSSTKAAGRIISQSPLQGTSIYIDPETEQCTVTITVSAKGESFSMIDVTSLSPDVAEAKLRASGFAVHRESIHCDTVGSGLVCSTSPATGEKVSPGSEIVIYVSLGPDVSLVAPPDFKGMTEAEAALTMKELGLKVGSVTYKASYLPYGTVLSQSAEPEEEIPVGTVIDFTVSGGADYKP
jgi:serine/threonine-protein kinase